MSSKHFLVFLLLTILGANTVFSGCVSSKIKNKPAKIIIYNKGKKTILLPGLDKYQRLLAPSERLVSYPLFHDPKAAQGRGQMMERNREKDIAVEFVYVNPKEVGI